MVLTAGCDSNRVVVVGGNNEVGIGLAVAQAEVITEGGLKGLAPLGALGSLGAGLNGGKGWKWRTRRREKKINAAERAKFRRRQQLWGGEDVAEDRDETEEGPVAVGMGV